MAKGSIPVKIFLPYPSALSISALHVAEYPTAAPSFDRMQGQAMARALHASVEVDDEIPVEHYHAVAEVIGFVMRMRRGVMGAG